MQQQITLLLIVIAAILLSPAATPTSASTPSAELDPAVIAAIIGLGGAILAALIAGGFVVYQQRKNAELQRLQHKQAQENAQLQHKQAQEIARLQQELQEQAQTKERERQRKEMNAADALAAMQHATTLAERVQAYRDSLRADPRIARLQILDMDRPLEVTTVYVRVRLHQESKVLYEDLALLHEGSAGDPNAFFEARQLRLEQRATSALNPEDA
ncbi:MAG: DUF1168 domain-containing protein, partial [Chloroflexi bacterium]|nr:DUF1168 domain-containing protein [Chloroflexota bacterium]